MQDFNYSTDDTEKATFILTKSFKCVKDIFKKLSVSLYTRVISEKDRGAI